MLYNLQIELFYKGEVGNQKDVLILNLTDPDVAPGRSYRLLIKGKVKFGRFKTICRRHSLILLIDPHTANHPNVAAHTQTAGSNDFKTPRLFITVYKTQYIVLTINLHHFHNHLF